MRLSDFILANIEPILLEWVSFARSLLPAALDMTDLELRNDAQGILARIAADMRTQQDERQRLAKSQGRPIRHLLLGNAPYQSHAAQRARSGFEINQMVSEYRALRASVLRLWKESVRDVNVHDLEDVTRFNESMDEALAESLKIFVEEADRARHLFLGVLSHDLRTPLGNIVNCANSQLRNGPESARESNLILRSAARMTLLLDDLLEYIQKHLGGGMTIELAPTQLDRFVRDMLDEIKPVSAERVIEFSATGNLQGMWDPRRLHQLLSNLVVNALKYGLPHSPITVTLDGTHGEVVLLAIHNFGKAISAEVLRHLFEPLVHAIETGTAEQPTGRGVGLGLYIAHEIVRAHSGTISVTSSDEQGTRFEIRLPRNSSHGSSQHLA